ncbi:hypothetical protein GCM10010525_20200 [Glutamicibacter bergerei]
MPITSLLTVSCAEISFEGCALADGDPVVAAVVSASVLGAGELAEPCGLCGCSLLPESGAGSAVEHAENSSAEAAVKQSSRTRCGRCFIFLSSA